MEELKEQTNNRPWLFKKGQSGNPMGRPPGRSLKDRAKAYLAGLTDEEAVDYFAGMDKRVVWEMAEGKALTPTDITSKGERIMILPPELIDKNNKDLQSPTANDIIS